MSAARPTDAADASAGPPEAGDDGRLRVVYLSHVAKLSGGEIALLRLLPHLDRVDPLVVLAEDGPLVRRLHEAGIPTRILPMSRRARDVRKEAVIPGRGMVLPIANALVYTFRVARLLRQLRPDLVHTNSLKAGVYGSIAARLAGIPVVWHVRDRIADDYLPRSAVHAVRLLLRTLPDAVIVNSEATMRTVPAAKPVVVHSIVPELIELSVLRERSRTADRPFRIGIVGRLAPWKGQDVFLRAFAAAFPAGDERAVVVGQAMFGEDAFAGSLPVLADRLGIGDRVEFRGFQEDVTAELAQMDILVHASTSAEPFGQVILEGLAGWVPVVAADGGGPSEILTHGQNGILYPPGDVAALAAELTRLRGDAGLRHRLAAEGHLRAGDFGPVVARDLVQDVYRRVLAKQRTRGRVVSPGRGAT